jgi:TatD DNase family protein
VIDSHTHLDRCEGEPAERVAAAVEAGVDRILTIGMDVDSCHAALDLADTHPQVWAAIGHHPNNADGYDDTDTARLRALAPHHRCVAIGETGLDYYREAASRTSQRRAFLAQIEIAREFDKALVIHTREAEEDTVTTLRERAAGLRVIMHCFSMPGRIEECVDQGWWISFAGNATYPKSQELRDAAVRVPANRLLVETDAPYLSPQPVRGRKNEPANVVHTAQAIAEARGVTYEELERDVERSAAEAFGW